MTVAPRGGATPGSVMGISVMIIDGQSDFRTLLMHHVTTRWPDAQVAQYDPTTAGHLPDEFRGAGNDLVFLGDRLGNRSGLDTLRRFLNTSGFPPVVYCCATPEGRERAIASGAHAALLRGEFTHAQLVEHGERLLMERRHGSARFDAAGRPPAVKGYRLLARLASTERSSVWLARRDSGGTRLALKIMQQVPDGEGGEDAFDRFLQEYELIAELDHPNIVRIFGLGVADDQAHIAMEYLAGGSLQARLGNRLREDEALAFLRQIAGALEEVHALGILHRDLKPGNIMLRDDGSIAVIDFGLAGRRENNALATSSGIFGTPYYMSPEQGHASRIDERSDLYSLGVIFYEMLTGEKLYTDTNPMTIIYKHRHAAIPRLGARLARYQPLVDRLLAKRPEERLQSASEVKEWL